MTWTIKKKSEKQYLIKDIDGMTKGDVWNENGDVWTVSLMMVPELTYVASTKERAIGYIRGVENTVNLYVKETGRVKKRA